MFASDTFCLIAIVLLGFGALVGLIRRLLGHGRAAPGPLPGPKRNGTLVIGGLALLLLFSVFALWKNHKDANREPDR